MLFQCSHCNRQINADEKYQGRMVICPECKQSFEAIELQGQPKQADQKTPLSLSPEEWGVMGRVKKQSEQLNYNSICLTLQAYSIAFWVLAGLSAFASFFMAIAALEGVIGFLAVVGMLPTIAGCILSACLLESVRLVILLLARIDEKLKERS